MTNFLLCVLIGTVAYGIDVFTSDKKKERQAVGEVMIIGLFMGGLLCGLIRVAGWFFDKYGSGLL